jgi:hypothetical protein
VLLPTPGSRIGIASQWQPGTDQLLTGGLQPSAWPLAYYGFQVFDLISVPLHFCQLQPELLSLATFTSVWVWPYPEQGLDESQILKHKMELITMSPNLTVCWRGEGLTLSRVWVIPPKWPALSISDPFLWMSNSLGVCTTLPSMSFRCLLTLTGPCPQHPKLQPLPVALVCFIVLHNSSHDLKLCYWSVFLLTACLPCKNVRGLEQTEPLTAQAP